MPIAELVADANVLLSAVVGHAALRVFTEFGVRVHAARFNVEELLRYLPRMASKYRLPVELVELQWRLLGVEIHSQQEYAGHFEAARQLLAQRDPEDAHPLALAWTLGLALWTHDRDFEACPVECYTTAELLRVLEQGSPG